MVKNFLIFRKKGIEAKNMQSVFINLRDEKT